MPDDHVVPKGGVPWQFPIFICPPHVQHFQGGVWVANDVRCFCPLHGPRAMKVMP